MKKELIYFAKRIYNAGLSPATSGNISCIDEDNNILITTSGSAMADLCEENIVKIDFRGLSLEENKKPSCEKIMHIKIYEKRPDIKAVIHSHSPAITAFAVSGFNINEDVIMPEFTLSFGKIPTSKYFMPSTLELAEDVSDLFKTNNAVLIRNHGVIVGAKTLKEAFYSLESIQAYCKTYLYSKVLGKIKTLNKSQIENLKNLNL